MKQIAIIASVAGLLAASAAGAQTPAPFSANGVPAVAGSAGAPSDARSTNEAHGSSARGSATGPSWTTRTMDLRPTGSIGRAGTVLPASH